MRATAPARCLGYARVSSAEQARGSSLQDQQDAIRRCAKARGVKSVTFFVEAESAVFEKLERRDQMRALMSEVKRGDLVLCDKIDRWSRDPEFTYSSIRRILEAGASFYAIAEDIDPSTSQGDSALSFRILFAREEHKRIKERMVGTANMLQDRGYYARGLPPLGYARPLPKGAKGAEKNVLVIEPKGAAIVRKAFALCIAGQSINRIAERLDISRDQVAMLLRRRTYVGEQRNSKGEWIRGKHPPIIDASTFAKAQAALDERRLGGPRPSDRPTKTRDWILRDVAVCGECGARMGSAWNRSGIEYYRCVHMCGARFVPVRLVEAAFTPLVLARLSDLREELARPPKESQSAVRVAESADVKRAKLVAQRERCIEVFTLGLTERAKMLADVRAIDARIHALDAVAAPPRVASPEVRREMLANVRAIEHAWRHAQPVARRSIIGHLAVRVALRLGSEPVPTWRNPEDLAGNS